MAKDEHRNEAEGAETQAAQLVDVDRTGMASDDDFDEAVSKVLSVGEQEEALPCTWLCVRGPTKCPRRLLKIRR